MMMMAVPMACLKVGLQFCLIALRGGRVAGLYITDKARVV